MTKSELKKRILSFLKTSTIPDHDKEMVRILLNAMKERILKDIYEALKKEARDMGKLDQKKKRIELKYKVMVEKLSEMEINKFKKPKSD